MGANCCNHDSAPRHDDGRYRRILWIALLVNLAMFLVEIGAGLKAGSVSLLADSLDFLGDAANYGNVGYSGSWANSYWLVDPASLTRMKDLGAAGKGVQRYELQQSQGTLRIEWDTVGRYARKIEQRNARGTSINVMTASVIPAPKTLPWKTVEAYERGDYSDLLD